MNDEELNELIARNEDEAAVFREIDAKRERDLVESWRAQGNRGKPPQPLMQFEELPECYQADEPFEVKEVDEVLEGRGQRKRNVVSYNDGLSDDAWALVSFSPAASLQGANASFRPLRKARTCKNLPNVPGRGKTGASRTSFSGKPKPQAGTPLPRTQTAAEGGRPRRARQKPPTTTSLLLVRSESVA